MALEGQTPRTMQIKMAKSTMNIILKTSKKKNLPCQWLGFAAVGTLNSAIRQSHCQHLWSGKRGDFQKLHEKEVKE